MGKIPKQLAMLFPPSWGGRRRGAGRKPKTGQRQMPHAPRPLHCGRHPVHVTLRSGFRSMRSQFVFPTVRAAIAGTSARRGSTFRIVHFSVQDTHVHLIVEADDTAALIAGVRGLEISIAKRINRLTFRRGTFWADRWHGRDLTTPRAVRHALVYVMSNGKKQREPSQWLRSMLERTVLLGFPRVGWRATDCSQFPDCSSFAGTARGGSDFRAQHLAAARRLAKIRPDLHPRSPRWSKPSARAIGGVSGARSQWRER